MYEEEGSLLDLQLDEVAVPALKEASRWTKFISITCMIGLAVLLLSCLLAGASLIAAFSRMPGLGTAALMGMGKYMLFVLVLVIAGIGGTITWMMYTFAASTRQAVDFNDQKALEKGINALRNYLMISAIFGILGLLINLLQLM
ncbi:hypothetical protein [Deminuibacter soli]|uniref:Uncharacterized protein n=1 Tax=Deminuibacter soli TaxID=2291815 RepID=A0A3E1NM33_9BACT|nr:hypothetical protein [Deminuibacter soli]RFM28961.1 hypothetical protein DXN05_09360 [Deminuibacter soli]